MNAAAASGGDDGRDDETRKRDERKRKEAERSRRNRAEKKAKDERDSKRLKDVEADNLELRKSLQASRAENAILKAREAEKDAEMERWRSAAKKSKEGKDKTGNDTIDEYFDYDRFQSDSHPPSGDAGGSSAV